MDVQLRNNTSQVATYTFSEPCRLGYVSPSVPCAPAMMPPVALTGFIVGALKIAARRPEPGNRILKRRFPTVLGAALDVL